MGIMEKENGNYYVGFRGSGVQRITRFNVWGSGLRAEGLVFWLGFLERIRLYRRIKLKTGKWKLDEAWRIYIYIYMGV